MEDLSQFADDEFDMVYASLAVHYLDDWSSMMSEIRRVLKSEGAFQFSMVHPIRAALHTIQLEGSKKIKGIGIIKETETKSSEIFGDYFAQGPMSALGCWMTGRSVMASDCPRSWISAGNMGFLWLRHSTLCLRKKLAKVSPKNYAFFE